MWSRWGKWGLMWGTSNLEPEDLDPGFVMWSVRRRIDWTATPGHRVVLHFSFRGMPARYRSRGGLWLVLDRGETDLCLKDPGHQVDLEVRADVGCFVQCWLHRLDWAEALRAGGIAVEGPPALIREVPKWLRIDPAHRPSGPIIRVPD